MKDEKRINIAVRNLLEAQNRILTGRKVRNPEARKKYKERLDEVVRHAELLNFITKSFS